jgi:transcriptional regulator with XRE-family HTH domain
MSLNLSHQIGSRIYRIRKQYGWTQERLAIECQMSRTVISSVENGDANPQTLTLARIAAGLAVPVGSLLPPEQQHAKETPC